MKRILFSFGLIVPMLAFAADGNEADLKRQYIPTNDLCFTEEGIFLKNHNSAVPLSSVSYDYQVNSFYIVQDVLARSGNLVKCSYCKQRMYDPDAGVCYNSECAYYPYYRSTHHAN